MMVRLSRAALCCASWMLSMAPAVAQPLVAPSEARSPQEQQALFHLPPGFEIQLVAAEPAIHKPINITFDARGRLWVTDTVEYPYPAQPGATGRDSVKVLADRNYDGSADVVTTFVDGLNIPLGVMPISDGVIVYSIGGVMRCQDTNGDGKADRRETLYTAFGSRDTHGMVNSFTRGLDGWLYACHGFANTSTPEGSDHQPITMHSGNTFRMRLDGSHLEYFTHGQVNPFGLTFDPLGNLYSADCHTMPIYMLLRGAYYPSFGKAHDGLDFGPTMIGHNHGSSGIGGIAYYAATQFPQAFRDTIFIGNPVTGRVNHDRLQAHGSTYEAVELDDFVKCDDPWFRPVNLQVGLDGALYIADFYNRIIGHYEVPLEHPGRDRERGRIWRVIYSGKGLDRKEPCSPPLGPSVAQASTRRLIELLGDDNLTIRTLATHELVDRGGAGAVEPLRAMLISPGSNAHQRSHGMWALERLGELDSTLITALSRDPDREVRVHLMKLLAERSWESSNLVTAALADPDGFVRRAAADALARHPRADNIKPLLALWAETDTADTHLVHVARMALRDQLLSDGVIGQLAGLVGNDTEQLERLSNVSLGVPSAASADFLWSRIQVAPARAGRAMDWQHVARRIDEGRLPEVYALALRQTTLDTLEQAAILRALGRAAGERGSKLPPQIIDWAGRLAEAGLVSDDERQVRIGIELARELHAPVFDALARAAAVTAKHASLRPAAIDACLADDSHRAIPLVAEMLNSADEPITLRQHCAAALARTNDDGARRHLVDQLKTAPERLAVEIANVLADSSAGGEALLSSVAAGKASPRLLTERTVVTRLGARKLERLDERLSALTAGLPAQDARIGQLIDSRRKAFADGKPDLVRGAAVFRQHCAICHRIGSEGAKIGPNLDGVGMRGLDRILEDVLDPNRNVDQAFRSTQIVTTDGRIVSGLALREEGQVLVLADSQGKEIRVIHGEIDQRTVSPLSPMPANLPDLVSEADFVHLSGYLLSQRETAGKP
jgi:putative heme-binding domain-containing protein